MDRQYYVYIVTNRSGTLYIGVTSNLVARVHQHKTKCIEGFTKKYNLTQLVYYEAGTDVREAIAREKQLKGWRRSKKLALIDSLNPKWNDLSDGWFDSAVIPSAKRVIPSETRDLTERSEVPRSARDDSLI
jgi:putative endonuclease